MDVVIMVENVLPHPVTTPVGSQGADVWQPQRTHR